MEFCAKRVKNVWVDGWEGGRRAEWIGKLGMADSGKEIRVALWVEAWVMAVRILEREEGVL
jgi:hypothetical protein